MSEVMSVAHSLSISRGSFSLLPGEEEEYNQAITTDFRVNVGKIIVLALWFVVTLRTSVP